ncbi:tyrosine-type recombinase/integrase [Rhodovulum sp. DZ06]|uniref:tyrosine-type recombinase/integrase n=1 Tax=Rhodovulum sp. DZ06 TaxID=3425126 RepID=UPI003D34D761
MAKTPSRNTRIKRAYLVWLKEARGLSETSVDRAAASLSRYEAQTRGGDFGALHPEKARAFKRALEAERTAQGRPLSASSVDGTLRDLKAFFRWLADQPGYRSKVRHSDADYFTPSKRTTKAAHGGAWRAHPSPEQALHALRLMPAATLLQRRDRAILATLLLTGARDGALVTLRRGNLDLPGRCIHFAGQGVETKFGKRFTTWFFPVGADVEEILGAWDRELSHDLLFGPGDPLFPRQKVSRGAGGFEADGLDRAPWSGTARVSSICRGAFEAAGLPPFTPHLLRKTLVDLAQRHCATPEAFKAWSQNLGHEDVLTTFRSYGAVSAGRQRELLLGMGGDDLQVLDD